MGRLKNKWFKKRSRVARYPGLAVREALLLLLNSDFVEAEKLLTELVKEDSGEIEAYLAVAQLYQMRGEVGRAIQIHQNLLLRRELNANHRICAQRGLADDFARGGFLDRAIATYRDVLVQDPNDAHALEALVKLYVDHHEFGLAIRMNRRWCKVAGRSSGESEANLGIAMGHIALRHGQYDSAKTAFKKALRQNRQDPRAWEGLVDMALI